MLARIAYPVFNRPVVGRQPLRFQAASLSLQDQLMAATHHAKNSVWALSNLLGNIQGMQYPNPGEAKAALHQALSSLKPAQKHLHGCDELILGCQQLSELLEKEDEDQKAHLMGELRSKCGTVQQNAVTALNALKAKQPPKSVEPSDPPPEMDIPLQLIFNALTGSYQNSPNIEWDYDPDLVVHTNPEVLDFALVNLINNAVKHCPEGTPIRVSAKRDPERLDQLKFVVSDKGPGIPQELLPSSFFTSLFFKGSKIPHAWLPPLFLRDKPKPSDPNKPDSTGVGLFITLGLVEAMNGDLTVRSVPGKGTRISFSIPLA